MANIILPIPTREAIAFWLKDFFGNVCKTEEADLFWYTMVDEKPELVLGILDHYEAKHPEAEEDMDILRKAIRAVTEDEQGAFEDAAEGILREAAGVSAT